jgi:hypothetical protein
MIRKSTPLLVALAAGLYISAGPACADALHPVAKDGAGSGSGSWIGYVFGGNQATGTGSAVAAGTSNLAAGLGAFVGAGTANSANGVSSLVIGGFDNHAVAIDSLIGAGAGNRATGPRSVVVGGGYNLASGAWSFIGGGGRESGGGVAGTSSQDQVAAGKWATIGGGMGNRAGSSNAQTGATVGGGEQNQAISIDATVAGGRLNIANAPYSTIAGGQANTASGNGATVGGGLSNTASGIASTIPGGASNLASGDYSFAAGQRARSVNVGSFVFADSSAFDFGSLADNEFAVRATGGVRFVTAVSGAGAPTAGVTLAAGSGSWSSLSDRAAKKDLAPVDGDGVLVRLAALPIYTWRYKSEVSGALHMGPTAQDFSAVFGLGDSDRRIATVDADGVALAAIQALYRQVQARQATLANQESELAQIETRISQLEQTQQRLVELNSVVAHLLQPRRR